MKKILLGLGSLFFCASAFAAAPQALYVKKGDSYTKYNFGVAGNLKFTDGGHKLQISGYSDIIDLDKIDCISFNAPLGQTTLTPYVQKQKMIEIGEAVNALVDLKSVGDLLRMTDAFFSHHELKNGDTFHPASEFEVPEEYWNLHNEARAVMKSLAALAKGNPAAVRSMRAKALALYKVADYFGVYNADQEKREWVKTASADYLELTFKGYDGTNYSVRLDAGKEFSTWETVDFQGQWPEKIDITFSVNSIKIADVSIVSKLVQEESIAMTTTVNASGYKVVDDLNISNSSVTDNVKVFVNGKESITAQSNIKGANLLKYDAMKDDIKEATHYHDEDDNCCGDDPESLISHFYRAQSEVDVLGKLQLKAKALDFSRLYDIVKDEDDDDYYRGDEIKSMNSDKSVFTVYDTEKKYRDMQVDILSYLNNYADVQFFYDGESTPQGFLSFDKVIDSWEDTYSDDYSKYYAYAIIDGYLKDVYKNSTDNWYAYINGEEVVVDPANVVYPSKIIYEESEIAPRLTFWDMTSYAFEDFFDESTFTPLINDYDNIIDTYETITGQK